jgi:hypothetical protein
MGSEHQLFDSNLTKKRTSEETDSHQSSNDDDDSSDGDEEALKRAADVVQASKTNSFDYNCANELLCSTSSYAGRGLSSAEPKAITTSKRRGVDNTRTDVATGAELFEATSTPQEDDSASEDGRKGEKGTTGVSRQGKDDAAGKRRAGASRQGNNDVVGKRRTV